MRPISATGGTLPGVALARQAAGTLGELAHEQRGLVHLGVLAGSVVGESHGVVADMDRVVEGDPGRARRTTPCWAGFSSSRATSRARISWSLEISRRSLPLHETWPSSVTRSVSRAPLIDPPRVTLNRSADGLAAADAPRPPARRRRRRPSRRDHRATAARVAGAGQRARRRVALDGLDAAEEHVRRPERVDGAARPAQQIVVDRRAR